MTQEMRQLRDAAERAGRPAALVTDGLSKRYGNRLAVDALSIEVPAGVVAGFIGPNGAGKTTASTSPHRSA